MVVMAGGDGHGDCSISAQSLKGQEQADTESQAVVEMFQEKTTPKGINSPTASSSVNNVLILTNMLLHTYAKASLSWVTHQGPGYAQSPH
jgi:hypothetical protein